MKINGIIVSGKKFAYDGCHKIYILDGKVQERQAREYGYSILNIEDLKFVYDNSCDLKFIKNWDLSKTYAQQFKNAIIEY